jgi:hypothetical protein
VTDPTTRPDRVSEIKHAIGELSEAYHDLGEKSVVEMITPEGHAIATRCRDTENVLLGLYAALVAECERMRAERDAIADRASGLVNVMATSFTEEAFQTALTALVSMLAAINPAPPAATSEEGT